MNRKRREPDLREALLIAGGLLLLFVLGSLIVKADIIPLLLTGAFASTLIFRTIYGFGWRELFIEGTLPLIGRTGSAMSILLFIGPLIAAWTLSGTIPYLMWLGISLISPAIFLLCAFLLCAFASLITGTSWGTAGTFGTALAGIGAALDIPAAAAAGAIVGGAWFGDKLSPVSDTTLLAASVAEVNVIDHIRSMLKTTVPAALLSLAVYTAASIGISAEGASQSAHQIRSSIEENFILHPALLIPPVLMLALAWRRLPVFLALGSAILVSVPFAIIQGSSLSEILKGMLTGTGSIPGIDAAHDTGHGGLFLAGRVIAVVCAAYIFVGQFQTAKVFKRIGDALKDRFIRGHSGKFIFSVSIVGLSVAISTGNTYLCSILPGSMFKELGDEIGVPRTTLSRTLEDSGTVVAPLVPWSAASVYMSSLLGVDTLDYLPWAVLCWSSFPIAWIIAFAGGTTRAEKTTEHFPESS